MEPRSPRRVLTQADLARLAGCSQNTVTLALRGSTRISSQRREQILTLARRHEYRPNVAARSLAQKRSCFIGVFTGRADDVRLQLVSTLLTQLHDRAYRPILGLDDSRPRPWYDSPWVQTLLDLRVEVLVALGWTETLDLPGWWRHTPLIIGGVQPDPTLPCDVVAVDRFAAGRDATAHLLSRGHRRIMVTTNGPRRPLVQGYAAALRAAGLTPAAPQIVEHGAAVAQANAQTLARHLAQQPPADRPTALLALNSEFAAHLLLALRQQHLRVPEDLALIGYDRFPLADMLAVPLSTIEQPVAQMSEELIAMTRRRLESPEAPPAHRTLEHVLALRQSA